jgi:hypothetical protein
MKNIVGLLVILSLNACATCKSTDSPEVCRTKQRNHSQPHADMAVGIPRILMSSLLAP